MEWGGHQRGCKPSTPAKSNLFNQENDDKKLNDIESDVYHSVIQKLMYICKRAKPDIKPALSYLCTKVSCPSIDDKEKFDRLLDYLHGTINDQRTLGATSLDEMITWVDFSFAVHANKRSHTGGTISFGVGVVHAKSSKQKLNTKSSTEAKLMGVSKYLPHHIWIVIFLKSQGYDVKSKILYQDNESAIKMEKNGLVLQ